MLHRVLSSPLLRRRVSSSTRSDTINAARSFALASSATVTAGLLWYSQQPVYNDAPVSSLAEKHAIGRPNALDTKTDRLADGEHLITIVWGSNKANLISPETTDVDTIKTPRSVSWLADVALRDLVLDERHAACVDVRGDVYQWGDDFFGSTDVKDRKPTLTLQGKNITHLQITASRVFALSSSGQIFVLSAALAEKSLASGVPTHSSSSWWGTGWLWGEPQSTDFTEIKADGLRRGEKFVSISAGRDHLLGLTSSGRAFAHPINKNANAYGQLGFRRFDVPNPVSGLSPSTSRIQLELTPKTIVDPYADSSLYRRPQSESPPTQTESQAAPNVDDSHIRFCDKLFEVPALAGVHIAQVVAGARSSFARTADGRILAWGANKYGQLGLGPNMTLTTITVPTEVVFSRSRAAASTSKCVNLAAGGDLAYFTVERRDGSSIPNTDLLSCGMGQWGGLGHGLYSSAQGSLVRVKTVSGLLEYSEATNNLQPIIPYAISVSPTGHVLLTLDTLARAGPGGNAAGRDLLVWGLNQDYQLGNGKKVSSAVAMNVESEAFGGRLMLAKRRAGAVYDLSGRLWRRGAEVEQWAVAGYGNSVVYWKVC